MAGPDSLQQAIGRNMRAPNNKRARGRTNRRSPNPNRSYESNGPDGKIRGNANQVYDKYSQLARDASASGDLVAAEGYWQHAEHYYRIMMSMQQNRPQQQPQNQQDNNNDSDDAQLDQPQGQNNGQNGGQNADQGGNDQPRNQRRDRNDRQQQSDPAEQEQPTVDAQASGNEGEAKDSDTAGLERAMRRSRPRRPRKPREEEPAETEAPVQNDSSAREAAEDAAD